MYVQEYSDENKQEMIRRKYNYCLEKEKIKNYLVRNYP